MKNIVFKKIADNVVLVNGEKFKVYTHFPTCQKVYTDNGVYIFDGWSSIKRNGVISIDVFTPASDFVVCYCCPEFTEMTDSHRHVRLLQDNLDTSSSVAERIENIEFWSGACDDASISLVCPEYDSKCLSLDRCESNERMLELACVMWVMYYVESMMKDVSYEIVVLDMDAGVTCNSVGLN